MNYQGGKVHIWTCDMCLAITFEYWEQEDAENIAAELKARRTNKADKVDEVYNKALWKSVKKQL